MVKFWQIQPMAVLLFIASTEVGEAFAQGITARMIFPPRNYELALGDTITPTVRVRNQTDTTSAPDRVFFRLRNAVTNITIVNESVLVPSLSAGDSLIVVFAPFISSSNILAQLGTFNACTFLASDTSQVECERFFGIRRTAVPFRDPSEGYSHTKLADIPDQTLWCSLGATIVDGDDSTWDPPPPRGGPFGPDTLFSPLMRLDRMDEAGNYYSGAGVGDTLNSFPINLQGKTHITFKFDYMRAGKHHYPFGWDTAEMFGPESTILDSAGNVLRPGDSLILEFKKPSAPAVNPGPNDWNEIAAIDGGHDFEFKSFFAQPEPGGWNVRIDQDTQFVADTNNYFTADFRFRLRLKASDNAIGTKPVDDADPWYIDDPVVSIPLLPELQVRWVRLVNPYTKIPQSQAIFPVYVDILNYGSDNGVGCPFRVKIFDLNEHLLYSQTLSLDMLMEGEDTVLRFPDWDATNATVVNGAPYFISAAMAQPGFDEYSDDDSTYTKFYLNVEQDDSAVQEFAYDDAGIGAPADSGNDIPDLTGIRGSGIGFDGTTGSFAMKFRLGRKDSLWGIRAYFGSASEAPDAIRISILTGDSNSCVPGDTLSQPGRETSFRDIRGAEGGNFDAFTGYYLPNPLILPAGTYWAAVSQLARTSMQLGGDFSRGSGELAATGTNAPVQPINNSQYGTQWESDSKDNDGDVGNSFAIEMPAGSGKWQPMMPKSRLWPAMVPNDSLFWALRASETTPWVGMGTYLPMIRVMLANSFPSRVNSENVPPTLAIHSCSPNPFDPNDGALSIPFSLPSDGQVSIIIYNTLGTSVRAIANGQFSSGEHRVLWDGRDNAGALVLAGTYVAALQTPDGVCISKFVVR